MSKIKGGDLMLFVQKGQTKKAIALATSHNIELQSELQSTSNKDEGAGDWSSQEVGLLSWSVSSENFFSMDATQTTYNDLFDMMIAKQPIEVVFSMKAETGVSDVTETTGQAWTPAVPKYTGKAVINSLSLNAPNGEYATFTANLTGVGALTKVTA